MIDRHNYHLFVPLLYQVAAAALSPADIAEPVRKILSRYPNIDVVLGEVTGIDQEAEGRPHRWHIGLYDRLVMATGSAYSYFGHDDWAQSAPGLKTIEDARANPRSRADGVRAGGDLPNKAEQHQALMTTVIVGGGPTGVEMAGAIAELPPRPGPRLPPHRSQAARILLVEAGPRPARVPRDAVRYARNRLEQLGVTVMTGHPGGGYPPDGATIGRFVPPGPSSGALASAPRPPAQ